MAELWRCQFNGDDYLLEDRDLTGGRLRQMKQWFGADYGAYIPFLGLLVRGDVDAVACALWIGDQKAGRTVVEPSRLDFNFGDVEFGLGDDVNDEPASKADPTSPRPRTRGSKSSATTD